jgi:hypothetical protein
VKLVVVPDPQRAEDHEPHGERAELRPDHAHDVLEPLVSGERGHVQLQHEQRHRDGEDAIAKRFDPVGGEPAGPVHACSTLRGIMTAACGGHRQQC